MGVDLVLTDSSLKRIGLDDAKWSMTSEHAEMVIDRTMAIAMNATDVRSSFIYSDKQYKYTNFYYFCIMGEIKNEWFIIVNPRAGSGRTMSQWVPAEHRLEGYGIPYVTAFTDHCGHATQLAGEAASMGYRKILAVGGDGSLHETLTGICQWCDRTGTDPSEFYLGVAPIGSGNDWIKSFGISPDIRQVIDLMAASSFCRMDVLRADSADGRSCYMANGCGTGFDAHVCVKVNSEKEAGHRSRLIYVKALAGTIKNLETIRIQVITDGKVMFEGPCYSVAAGNGRYSGGGMRQVSIAETDDGLIDVMVVPVIKVTTIAREVPRLFNGTVHKSSSILYARCRHLQIVPLDSMSADTIEVDGEIEGRLPLSITTGGRQINVLCQKKPDGR